MNRLTSTEATTVSAKGRNHSPETPGMNATGTNTATMEKVVAATARPISAVPLSAARRRSSPRSMWRTMFSRTTIASSISTPIASDRPSSVMKLSVKPHSHTAMKAAITEVGRLRAVMSVERQEFRKMYTTKIVSPAPNTSACTTLFRLFSASSPPSCVTVSVVPAGSVLLVSWTSLRTSSATLTVLASRARVMDRPTLGLPLRALNEASSAKPSCTVASCPRRTTSSPRRRTTTCSNWAGDSMRPTRRMLWSSRPPRTLPTGAVVFWLRSAFTTSATEMLYSRSFSARSSTDSSRLSAPLTLTTATPGSARKRSASSSSARREISAWVCVVEARASCITGCADGSTRCSTGSRISVGSL